MLKDSEIRNTPPKDSAFKLFDSDGLWCSPSGRAIHTSVCSLGDGESGARARLASRISGDAGRSIRCDILSQHMNQLR
jgi:hypothetical protein